MTPILIMELRGFTQLATDLARELEKIEATPARIRASGIDIVRQYISLASKSALPTRNMHLGGDTWYWNFHTISDAIKFGVHILNLMREGAIEKGIFYLKPSMAIAFGDPKFDGERFLDDPSISAYKLADGGRSFILSVIGDAIAEARSLGIQLSDHPKFPGDDSVKELNWLQLATMDSFNLDFDVSIPRLLLDSEIIYSNKYKDAITNIIRLQETSDTALVYGGPGSLQDAVFRNYISSTIRLLRSDSEIKFSVLSYLPLDEPDSSYTWLELCRSMQVEFPQRFAFSAFGIPKGQLRPFSYHVYNGEFIHIGLRAYSPQKGTPTLSSAIMLKNKKIANRFEIEFVENFRSVGVINDAKYAKLLKSIGVISTQDRTNVARLVREVMQE